MQLIQALVDAKVLEAGQARGVLALAEKKYEGNTEAALIELGVSSEAIVNAKSLASGIPTRTVDPRTVTTDILNYVPEETAQNYHFIPIGLADGVLEVGIVDPDNMQAMDALQFITSKAGVPFRVFVISLETFNTLIKNYKGLSGEVGQALSDLDTEIAEAKQSDILKKVVSAAEGSKKTEDEKIVEDAPIIKIVAVILNHATEGNASDIHIENVGDKVKVRFRVDGVLHTSLILPIAVFSGIVARIKILSKIRLDEKRIPQDGGFSAKISGRKVDFRVSTLPAYYGEKVVIRILDSERGVKPLDSLGMSPENLARIREAIQKPYGLILVTGPTGSGKTTTLYSILNEFDREKYNIVSLEDPVEYQIPNVNQSQVMASIGYTFANGLRSILRQDPDIIMVGEIRDKETAQLAIQAALTGHVVLSTLHTNNALGVVPRLIDMGVDPYLIAPTLILSVAQRLVKMTCPTSRHEVPTDETIKALFEKQFTDLPEEFRSKLPLSDKMFETIPSPECPSGTRGRMAVFEMLPIDRDMQNLILKSPGEQEIYDLARKKGMLTMKEDAMKKGILGEIPFAEVYGL